ncbi:tachykinin-like peptides receptor 86C [Oculina patagonica]
MSNDSISTEGLEFSLATKVAFTTLTSVSLLVSCIGNSLVIHIVRKNQLMKSTTYLLILNMACADLITTIVSCILLISYMSDGLDWVPGTLRSVLCKINLYVVLVPFLGCVFSLVGITTDRYLAVSRPLKHKPWTKWTKLVIPVIWVTSLLLPLDSFLGATRIALDSESTYCSNEKQSFSMVVILAICFLLPFTVMAIFYPIISYHLWKRQVPGQCNARQQQMANRVARKVTKMMVTVIVVFFICWAPTFVLIWLHPFATNLAASLPLWLVPFCIWLQVLNCIMTPVIYAIFNDSFRKGFQQYLCCGKIWKRNIRDLEMVNASENQIKRTPVQSIQLLRFNNNLAMEI